MKSCDHRWLCSCYLVTVSLPQGAVGWFCDRGISWSYLLAFSHGMAHPRTAYM